MKTICGLDRPSFFLFRMPWLLEPWIDAATAFAAQLLGDSLKTVHWTVFACKAGRSLPFYIFVFVENKVSGLSLPWPAHITIGIVWWSSYFCFRLCTGTGEILRAGNLFFQICRDRLYVFDSGRFSWNLFLNCDSGFAFLFWTGTLFFSHKKDCFF